jgi:ribosome-binding protein aMBF1 (putative translation factor)
MRAEKRKRLEAKGWKIGSTKDLLDLSDQEAAYIELRFKLAQGLKARRHARGFSQTQLAKAVQSSESRVAKMESGDPTVSLDLLVRSLLALGA